MTKPRGNADGLGRKMVPSLIYAAPQRNEEQNFTQQGCMFHAWANEELNKHTTRMK
jgi:hypothetical protein